MVSKRTPQRVHEDLLDKLNRVDRPSAVCASCDWPLTMPGLEIDGLGTVRLPLGKAQAGKLINLCRQAPYGKGTETVVDTDVRRVWELDPEHFQLLNPKWDATVEEIVASVQRDLGLERQNLKAHLYKILVYEKGSFFLPHRDGEKLDRMVATLVIGLPSPHEGGELIVSHDGRRHRVEFTGAASGHELSYAAFYSDCEHETRPLRSGYRLCLIYNVTLARSRGKQGISAPTYLETTDALTGILQDWSTHEESRKLAVTLDHRYTRDGLVLDGLKGVDRARAETLFDAAEQAGCVAHLALVTLWQVGNAEGGYDDRYSHGRDRWRDRFHEMEIDEDEGPASEHEMGEIHDQSLSASHWSDRHGKKVRFGQVVLEENEIVSKTPLEEQKPSREDFEGYTGNAGMTLERWYHRAAIVVWPREKHFDALCSAGTEAAIGGFKTLVKQFRRAAKSKRESLRRECLAFADTIVASWDSGYRWRSRDDSDRAERSEFLPLLIELDEPDRVRRFMTQVMITDRQVRADKSLGTFCDLSSEPLDGPSPPRAHHECRRVPR